MARPAPGSHPEPTPTADANLDASEVARFSALARDWWDPHGPFATLHRIGPERIGFIRDSLIDLLGPLAQPAGLRKLIGLSIVDIGCGGGLVGEPLARLGARVTAIDPSPQSIAAAKAHAEAQGLVIDYRAVAAEALALEGRTYDAVACLEVVEHVPDVGAFLKTLARLVRPGGVLVLSTLNRTLASYLKAIIAAEYVLGWVPRGTHDWERFVTPDELKRHLAAAGCRAVRFEGLSYSPLHDTWRRDPDLSVNYMVAAVKPAAPAA